MKQGFNANMIASTPTFVRHQSQSQLINPVSYPSFGFSPDFSHYGTSEFQRQPPMQTIINGIALRKQEPRIMTENQETEEADASQSMMLQPQMNMMI